MTDRRRKTGKVEDGNRIRCDRRNDPGRAGREIDFVFITGNNELRGDRRGEGDKERAEEDLDPVVLMQVRHDFRAG